MPRTKLAEQFAPKPEPIKNYPDILNLKEFMEYLRVGYSTAMKLLNSGEIPHKHFNREWRIPRQAVLDWVNSPQQDGGDPGAVRLPNPAAKQV